MHKWRPFQERLRAPNAYEVSVEDTESHGESLYAFAITEDTRDRLMDEASHSFTHCSWGSVLVNDGPEILPPDISVYLVIRRFTDQQEEWDKGERSPVLEAAFLDEAAAHEWVADWVDRTRPQVLDGSLPNSVLDELEVVRAYDGWVDTQSNRF